MLVSLLLLAALAGTAAVTVPAPRHPLQGRSFTGRGTFFSPGLGSCGFEDTESNKIVALSLQTMQGGSLCNEKIRIKAKGKSVVATIRDTCQSCRSVDVDMSPSLFKHFGVLDEGVIQVTWDFQ